MSTQATQATQPVYNPLMVKQVDQYDPALGGTPVRPMLPYADVWRREKLDSARMNAYRTMEAEGQLKLGKITYNRSEGLVVIEYRTTIPHEWVLQELKKLVSVADAQRMVQMSFV